MMSDQSSLQHFVNWVSVKYDDSESLSGDVIAGGPGRWPADL